MDTFLKPHDSNTRYKDMCFPTRPYLVKCRDSLFSSWEIEPERVRDCQDLSAGLEGPCGSWFSLLGLAASEASEPSGQGRLLRA